MHGALREKYSKAERELRCKLAALYRLTAHFGWDHLIYSHITVIILPSLVCMSECLYVRMSVCQLVCMLECLYVSLSVCHVSQSCMCLYVSLSVCHLVCMLECLYVSLSVCQHVCMSVCLYVIAVSTCLYDSMTVGQYFCSEAKIKCGGCAIALLAVSRTYSYF